MVVVDLVSAPYTASVENGLFRVLSPVKFRKVETGPGEGSSGSRAFPEQRPSLSDRSVSSPLRSRLWADTIPAANLQAVAPGALHYAHELVLHDNY
jgi:hypothetical protein